MSSRRQPDPARRRPSLLDRYAVTDRAVLALGRAYLRLTAGRTGLPVSYFSRGVESEGFADHLAAVRLHAGRDWTLGRRPLAAGTLVGPLDAAVRSCRWVGPRAPSLVYHHGGGEVPADRTIRRLLAPRRSTARQPATVAGAVAGAVAGWNVLVVESPYHDRVGRVMAGGAEMRRYLAMMATAVSVTELLVRTLRAAGSPGVRVAGASLGGFVTVRHHLAFDSADSYVPLVAGTAHGEIFLRTYPAAVEARRRPDTIRRLLDTTAEWRAREHPTVRPVLGRFDPLNPLDVMAPSFAPTPVDVWPHGHLGCLADRDRLSAVLFGPIPAVPEERPPAAS